MQSAKATLQFRQNQYDVEIMPLADNKINISVIDSLQKVQYYEKQVTFEKIVANTLIKGLEKTQKSIIVTFEQKHVCENDILEITVLVEMPFIKSVTETIYLKKIREVSESETVKKAIDNLAKKIKKIKESQKCIKTSLFGAKFQATTYNSGIAYEPLASVKLSKGKYLLTFNCLVKATSFYFYIFLNQGQIIIPSQVFYLPSNSQFVPCTFRKIYSVSSQTETVSITTHYGNSYPVTIKNAILVARPLPE